MVDLGIEKASVFNLPPIEFVELAARLGCRHISAGLASFPYERNHYPAYSFRSDTGLRRRMIDSMDSRGVSISLMEGFVVQPAADVKDYDRDLDTSREMGAPRINVVSMDPDLDRTFDQFSTLHEMAADRGLEVVTEFAPCLAVADLPTALAAVRYVNDPGFRLLIDTMHVVRSGSGTKEIAALDPELIGYVQLSDAPRVPRFDDYLEEAMNERVAPGAGELGIPDLLTVLPRDRVFGLEVPMRGEMMAGVQPYQRLAGCVRAARALFAETQ